MNRFEEVGRGLSRRSWIPLAGASAVYGFGGREFWESKDPAEWNSDEIAKLLTKSPWAKATSTEGGARPGGRGRIGRTPRAPQRNASTYRGTVVWESAAPVRAALKTNLPEGFEGKYVLGVSGLPLTRSDSGNAMGRIRQLTTLQCKGRQPIGPAMVTEETSNGTVYLFGFSREALPLTREDKDIVFTTHMGRFAYIAKFNPKEMLYRGELAV